MSDDDVPYGKISAAAEVGAIVSGTRRSRGLTQVTTAGLCGVGTRFLSELERGKPTLETGKVLQVLERMGLEVWIVPRGETRWIERP